MSTFLSIKRKIEQYEKQTERLQKEISEKKEELKSSIYSLWLKTKFVCGKKGNTREYFYLSFIDPASNDFFTGIWLGDSGKLTIGKMPFIPLYDFDEYEEVAPQRFFGKLKAVGINLNEYDDPIAIECSRYRPAIVCTLDDAYKVVGYCRLSQSTKTKNLYDRQITLIRNFSERDIQANLVELFAETIQGTVSLRQRKGISEMIDYCACNDVHTVIVSELNRLGRTENVIMGGISLLMKKGIREIYCIKENVLINEEYISEHYRELRNLAKSCETEYDDIVHRMRTGYESYVDKTKKEYGKALVGRRNYRKSKEKYLSQYSNEIGLLTKGLSMRQVRTITGTSLGTLQKLKNIIKPDLKEVCE
jgi:DNA invertase Pin-like site-specific DNA recombinase